MKIERTRIHFLSDVFSASPSSDLKVPINDGDGHENVTKKVNSCYLERFRAYSNSSSLSNVGKFFWS